MAKPNAKGQQTTGQQQAQGQMAHGKKDKRHRAHWAKDAQAAIYPPPPQRRPTWPPRRRQKRLNVARPGARIAARRPRRRPRPSRSSTPRRTRQDVGFFTQKPWPKQRSGHEQLPHPPPTPIVKPSSTRTRSGGRSTRPPWRPYRRAPRTQAAHRGADGHHYALPCFADTLRDGRRGGGVSPGVGPRRPLRHRATPALHRRLRPPLPATPPRHRYWYFDTLRVSPPALRLLPGALRRPLRLRYAIAAQR